MNKNEIKQKAEKPSIFETMKDSMKDSDKSVNRRSDAKNHSSLMKSIYQTNSYK